MDDWLSPRHEGELAFFRDVLAHITWEEILAVWNLIEPPREA